MICLKDFSWTDKKTGKIFFFKKGEKFNLVHHLEQAVQLGLVGEKPEKHQQTEQK